MINNVSFGTLYVAPKSQIEYLNRVRQDRLEDSPSSTFEQGIFGNFALLEEKDGIETIVPVGNYAGMFRQDPARD